MLKFRRWKTSKLVLLIMDIGVIIVLSHKIILTFCNKGMFYWQNLYEELLGISVAPEMEIFQSFYLEKMDELHYIVFLKAGEKMLKL